MGDRAETKAKVGTGEVWVAFRPALLTSATTDHIQASMQGDDGPLLRWLSEAIIEWDVQGRIEGGVLVDSEDVLPHDPDTLKAVPSVVLLAVFTAIQNAATVPEANTGD